MSVEESIFAGFETISIKILSSEKEERTNVVNNEEIEFISRKKMRNDKENSRFVPIKLTKKQAERVHECQKVMLDFAYRQYKASVGTKKEEVMKKLYNDALIDYNDFVAMHRNLIKA